MHSIRQKVLLFLTIAIIFVTVPLFVGQHTTQTSMDAFETIKSRQIGLIEAAGDLQRAIAHHRIAAMHAILSQSAPPHSHDLKAGRIVTALATIQRLADETENDEILEAAQTLKARYEEFINAEILLDKAIRSGNTAKIKQALHEHDEHCERFSLDTALINGIAERSLSGTVATIEATFFRAMFYTTASILFAVAAAILAFLTLNRLNRRYEQALHQANVSHRELEALQRELQDHSKSLEHEVEIQTRALSYRYYHNPLTGLPNRNRFLEDYKHKRPCEIALFNLDKFQEFNDLFGEEMGNEALRAAAHFFETHKENAYNLYHISGDEFAITANGSGMMQTFFVESVSHLVSAFNQHKFLHQDEPYYMTASVGIAQTDTQPLACADIALKQAKRHHSGIWVYDHEIRKEEEYETNLRCAKQLIDALEADRLEAYFQPIASAEDGRVVRYEALARIVEPDGSLIAPKRFVNVSKRIHVYHRLTKTMFAHTLAAIETHGIACSFNISVDDIIDSNTVSMICNALTTFAHNDRLTIEILETEAIMDYDEISRFVRLVKSYGVKVAIDDFGSGYSNFTHILKLPIDFLKIDAEIIVDINTSDNSRALVEAVIMLAKKMGVETVAEFVSSEAIHATLVELGIDYVQGYYIAEPMSAQELFGL